MAEKKLVSYTVASGDSLTTIAGKNKTTWQEIYELNRDVIGSNPNVITPGMRLKVPASGGETAVGSGSYGPDKGPDKFAEGDFVPPYYTVVSGDTLSGIGQRFNIPWNEIAKDNDVKGDVIRIGQRLLIRGWKK